MSDRLEPLGLTQTDLRDPFLRRLQRVYDERVFDRAPLILVNAGIEFRLAKTVHIGMHIGKALGKTLSLQDGHLQSSTLVETEAFPDTLMYRTQLANTLRYDLARHLGNTSTNKDSLIEADDCLTVARTTIDIFSEALDHGEYVPQYLRQIKEVAIPSLHIAGLIMANMFDVDPTEAHMDRILHNFRSKAPQVFD